MEISANLSLSYLTIDRLMTLQSQMRRKMRNFVILKIIDFTEIDLFAVLRMGLRRAWPILTALAAVGYRKNPLSVASLCRLELFSINLYLSRVKQYLFCPLSVLFGLFSYLVILSPIGECIMSHFTAGNCPRL